MSKNLQLSDNVNYMTPDKFKEVLEECKNLHVRKLDNIDIQFIFKIAYYAGLRINEVLKLSKSSFDFNLLQIKLGQTKTKKHDIASFPEKFSDELKEYIATRKNLSPNEFLFPISRQTAYTWIMHLGVKLDVPSWVTPQSESGEKTKTHIFRKSIGKDMIKKGAPLNVIMNKLRHNNLATTSEYLKLNLSDVQTWENEN